MVSPPEAKFRGNIDAVLYATVCGWALDLSEPGRPPLVALRIGGKVVAEGIANKPLPGRAGFGFEMVCPTHIIGLTDVQVMIGEGRDAAIAVWGEGDQPLPAAWRDGGHCRFPSFFVLGAAKSGTTSLHVYLDQHPDVFMSKPKEPFFFEREYECGADYYFRKYFGAWSGQPFVGESRHRNLYLPYVPERIHRHNPNARLVAILRSPVTRAVSHWWHWYSRGLEPLGLMDALEADHERILTTAREWSGDQIAGYVRSLDADDRGIYRTYLDTGYYAEQLERYIGRFGAPAVCVILFEELVAAPREAMARLFEFIGADPGYAARIDVTPLNESVPGAAEHVDGRIVEWLASHYRRHNARLEALLGRRVDVWNNAFGFRI
jgi:hypothetical protein